jgi:hypothetical protein
MLKHSQPKRSIGKHEVQANNYLRVPHPVDLKKKAQQPEIDAGGPEKLIFMA